MEINGVAFKETASGASNATQTLADTFDTFLSLLTTQLQNQDPLDPLDSNQFTEQLVQFSGVEQAIRTNQKLDQLVELQANNQLNAAVSYIGKNVEAIGDRVMLEGGSASIAYGLASNAAETVIGVVDDLGRTVRTISAELGAGPHSYTWDGRDDGGTDLPDGVYSFAVTALDRNGDTIEASTATVGRVTGIELADNIVMLNIGELDVPLESVFAVRETGT